MDNHTRGVGAEGLLGRADFLKLAGAAGVGAAAGASLMPAAEAAVRTNLDPTDFTFRTRERFRPFSLLARKFVQLDDGFGRNTLGNYVILRPGAANEDDGLLRAGDGKLRFIGLDGYYTVLRSDTGQEAPYATVIVDVESLPGGAVYAGLYKDGGDYVHAFYDKSTNTVGLEAAINGTVYNLGGTQPAEQRLFDAPFRFAFVANENEVTALVGDNSSDIGDFQPIIKRDVRFETRDAPTGALDLRDATILATFRNGFGARSDAGSSIVFNRVRAGYYGEAGVRDPHVVQYADGKPYIKNNKLYFTLTNAGLGFFEKAHFAVWTMDLDDYANIEQVGNVFWRNAGDASKVLGHHAGQIVRDEVEDRWIVVASSWGDFGPQGGDGALTPGTVTPSPTNPPVDIIYDEVPLSVNVLEGVHILRGRKHPVNAVPRPTEGKWDPGLTRINGRWYMAYVIANDLFTDFQPALARSPRGADHTVMDFVGTDAEKRATEGPIIQKLGGEWRVFASCGDDEPAQFQGRYPIYDLDMGFTGYLNAPHPTNIPHPMIVPIPVRSDGRARTKYIMITFNGIQYYIERLGYGTHGDFYVMEADQTVRGREF